MVGCICTVLEPSGYTRLAMRSTENIASRTICTLKDAAQEPADRSKTRLFAKRERGKIYRQRKAARDQSGFFSCMYDCMMHAFLFPPDISRGQRMSLIL